MIMGKIRIKQVDENISEKRVEVLSVKQKSKKTGADGKPVFPTSIHGRSTRYKNVKKGIINKAITVKEAVEKVKNGSTAKFVESIELHLNLVNVDKIGKRTNVKLPHPFSTKKKILYITTSGDTGRALKSASEAKDIADITIKGEEAIDEIKKSGTVLQVDQIWADPSIMPRLASIAKIIGPAGLMPNPKHGTLVKPEDLAKSLKSLSEGNITISTEKKAPIIHAVIGKSSMSVTEISKNVDSVIGAFLIKDIKSAFLASTMGPSVKLNLKPIPGMY